MRYVAKRYRKPVVERLFSLVILAILAGILGGGLVGFATDHHISSPTSSASLNGQ